MDIRLLDKWRNVTTVPTKTAGPIETLDGLLEGQNASGGQLEFECDRAFLDALGEQSDAQFEKPSAPWRPGHEANYKGVPIVVMEG